MRKKSLKKVYHAAHSATNGSTESWYTFFVMKQPLITVVIPVYNVESYIKECLDSISAQTYQNLEILAVNDGSTDHSRQLLEEAAAGDSRIQILDKENGGLSDARNYGTAYAKGKYICFIDGDDMISPVYVEHLLTAMQNNGADIAACDMEYVYEDGKREYSSGGDFTCESISTRPSLIRINNSACNKLYRTALFEEVNYPKGKLYEDLATVPILIYRSQNVAKVDEPLYFYRQRSGSIQHKIDERVFHIYDAIDRCRDYVLFHGREETILEEIRHMYIIYGLDITTLKIKDMDQSGDRIGMLKQNMKLLTERYPDYRNDSYLKQMGFKKKLIFWMLSRGYYQQVLKLYDR